MAGVIRVPEEAKAGLVALASMAPDQYERLNKFVRGLPNEPVLSRTLDRALQSEKPEDQPVFFDTVNHLARLTRTAERVNLSPSDIIEPVVSQSVRAGDQNAELVSTLKARLTELLAVDTISLHVKAWQLLYEEERYITSLRIITDLRPLFDESGSEQLRAFVVNRLHVTYVEDQKRHDIFFALDENDIEQLVTIAERAKTKITTLKKKAEAMTSSEAGNV